MNRGFATSMLVSRSIDFFGTFLAPFSGDPLFLGIRWYMDPFGDPYNTVGYKVVTKKPGQIAKSCWKNPSDCRRLRV